MVMSKNVIDKAADALEKKSAKSTNSNKASSAKKKTKQTKLTFEGQVYKRDPKKRRYAQPYIFSFQTSENKKTYMRPDWQRDTLDKELRKSGGDYMSIRTFKLVSAK